VYSKAAAEASLNEQCTTNTLVETCVAVTNHGVCLVVGACTLLTVDIENKTNKSAAVAEMAAQCGTQVELSLSSLSTK